MKDDFGRGEGIYTIAPPHQHISDIQHQRSFKGIGAHKRPRRPRPLDLEAPTIILEQQSEGVEVRVRRQPLHLLRPEDGLGDGRVVPQTQLVLVPGVESQQVVLGGEIQAERERAEDLLGELPAGPVERGRERAEAGQEGVGEPDVGIGGGAVAADAVGLLRHASAPCISQSMDRRE